MKTCKSCNRIKQDSLFTKRRISKDGLRAICTKCSRIYNKKYYLENIERYIKYREKNSEQRKNNWKEWYKLNAVEVRRKQNERSKVKRYIVIKHYSRGENKCNCCNESNIMFLTVDHIYNNGNSHRKEIGSKSGQDTYRWLIKNNFPEGFQILCFNCNLGKSINKGICPHNNQ